MRILIEAHHPSDIHFWKFTIRKLISLGHKVHMIARDRDVMSRLLDIYDWIPHSIPTKSSPNNKFPLREFILRQAAIALAIHRFRPDVVASLFGSYSHTAKLLGIRNIIFTDSEFQHFNHRIAHPFADEIHTPYCYYKKHGFKQYYYRGIHELSFLSSKYFEPDIEVLKHYKIPADLAYVIIRLSAWNTMHDFNQSGISTLLDKFIDTLPAGQKLVISAEEGNVDPKHRQYGNQFAPEDFHHLLGYASFVLTEGASTAAESACLGVPTVYINSTEPRGYLQMLESKYGIVRNFRDPAKGIEAATEWISEAIQMTPAQRAAVRVRVSEEHTDVCNYIVETLVNRS